MRVAVFEDGVWCSASTPELEEMTDRHGEYDIREAEPCPACFGLIVPVFRESIAYCDCGSREWLK